MPVAEARFCRMCGTPLRPASRTDADAPVSPIAQTIPLRDEGRATDGLSADKPGRTASDTSRVGRAEMEQLLRSAPAAKQKHAEDGAKTRAVNAREDDDAKKEAAPPQMTTLIVDAGAGAHATELADEEETVVPPLRTAPPQSSSQPSSAPNVRSRRMWQVAAIVLLFIALAAGALAFILSRRASSVDGGAASSPISIQDQEQLVRDKLAEAEALLSAGEFNRAVTVLRAAVKLAPANTEVRMRLGNALERTGAREEAIKEYRAATQSSPENTAAWRALASAQFEEKLYGDAADSYQRLLAIAGQGEVDDETKLAYADAARLAGRRDVALDLYLDASASASPEVAEKARRYLSEMGAPAAASNDERGRETRDASHPPERTTAEVSQPTPTPAPPARTTPTPAAADAVAQNDYDAYYFQAVSIVNGRDPKAIERAELLRALALFQRAALGGSHRSEAQRFADRLGKEYDRRRKG